MKQAGLNWNLSCPISSHQLFQRWLATLSSVTGRRNVYSQTRSRVSSVVSQFRRDNLRTGWQPAFRNERNDMNEPQELLESNTKPAALSNSRWF